MNKRILATILWFTAGWTFGAMATFFLGLPEGLNIALAVIVAAVVWWDPYHLLWPQGRRLMTTLPSRKLVGKPRITAD